MAVNIHHDKNVNAYLFNQKDFDSVTSLDDLNTRFPAAAAYTGYVNLNDAKFLHTKTDIDRQNVTNMGTYPIYSDMTLHKFQNKSGGALAYGAVVIYDSANVQGVITTTTAQDWRICGCVYQDSIADDAWGYIIQLGETGRVKVNGTVNIAIDDPLETFTDAGIARKGTVGSGACFAIARAAYTNNDSNGQIAAVLISPR